jgi:two-component system, NarL family, response regulator NreC
VRIHTIRTRSCKSIESAWPHRCIIFVKMYINSQIIPNGADLPVPELRPISLIFADDHEVVREGLVALYSSDARLRVIGQCGDGLAALEMIQSRNPDFAVIDLNMPKLGGLDLIRKLRAANHPCKLVVLSMSHDERMAIEVLRAGADGYVPKDGPARHLVDAIQYIQDGGVYISPIFPGDLLSRRLTGDDPVRLLTEREREVFYCLVAGMRPKQIASALDLSPKTVDTHRSHLMGKLNINDVAGLVKFAIKKNLIPEE